MNMNSDQNISFDTLDHSHPIYCRDEYEECHFAYAIINIVSTNDNILICENNCSTI